MSLADSLRKKRSRPTVGADPARAFGAEELTMEEIQQQNFVPPREKLSGLAHRAGAAIGSLRQKIVGEEPVEEAFPGYHEPEPAPRTEAPVYSSRTYQSESAPELGWENPFTNPSPKKKDPVRAYSSRPNPSVRSYPQYPDYPESPYGYAPPASQSFSRRGGAPGRAPANAYPPAYGFDRSQDAVLSGDYYPPEGYYPSAPYDSPTGYGSPGGYAPPNGYYPESRAGAPFYPYPYGYSPAPGEYVEEWTDNYHPPVRRKAPKKAESGDFKYIFWSVSIVVSVLLTLTAFIYGCTV